MRIGMPKEIKSGEARVALMPDHVAALIQAGHEVSVETGAGAAAGADDDAYAAAGASIAPDGRTAWTRARTVVKVKEPMAGEFDLIRPDHIVFTNLHTALNRALTDRLLDVGCVGFAAEDTHEFGSPNGALAGEIGAMEGIRLCLAAHGGTGRHFFPHFGAPAVKAAVLGLGNVGRGALRVLLGLGCEVVGVEAVAGVRYRTEQDWDARAFRAAAPEALPGLLPEFDLIVNCVLWPKERPDHLIARADLQRMKPGALICDISCDTAGAIETSRPTSWAEPVYEVDGIRHFCVDNLPGATPIAASRGYGAAILPRIEAIAARGWKAAARADSWLARGLVCARGCLFHHETARLQDRALTPADAFLAETD